MGGSNKIYETIVEEAKKDNNNNNSKNMAQKSMPRHDKHWPPQHRERLEIPRTKTEIGVVIFYTLSDAVDQTTH